MSPIQSKNTDLNFPKMCINFDSFSLQKFIFTDEMQQISHLSIQLKVKQNISIIEIE